MGGQEGTIGVRRERGQPKVRRVSGRLCDPSTKEVGCGAGGGGVGFVFVMAKVGSVVVACGAILLGGSLGFAGAFMMLEAGSFFSGESSQSNGVLGLFGGSEERVEAGTPPWVGLLAAMLGGGLLLFGFRALFAAFEGRDVA